MADISVEAPPLFQGVAYGIVLGFGIVFAMLMNLITWISRRYLHESKARWVICDDDCPTLMRARMPAC